MSGAVGAAAPLPDERPVAPATHAILLVEDEPAFRELLEGVLRSAGYAVHAAADGRSALRLLTRHQVDLIVTDLCMPGADGMEFLMALRTMRSTAPVIAMSGGVRTNLAGMLHAAQLLGARRTLEKPFALRDFVQAVQTALSPGS